MIAMVYLENLTAIYQLTFANQIAFHINNVQIKRQNVINFPEIAKNALELRKDVMRRLKNAKMVSALINAHLIPNAHKIVQPALMAFASLAHQTRVLLLRV